MLEIHGKPIAVKFSLSGTCNCCGKCCQFNVDGRPVYCENLLVKKALGEENATECTVHSTKYDQMPIRMLDAAGNFVLDTVCAVDSKSETKAIFERGVGRGCSLVWSVVSEGEFR